MQAKKITGGSKLCAPSRACADPWPFPPRVPGPRETTYPAYGRLCPPKALKPVASGYNTSRSTGFPTFDTTPSWLLPSGLGCPTPLDCPKPYWHDYSLGNGDTPSDPGGPGSLVLLGGLVGAGIVALLLPFGVGAVVGAALAPKAKRKKAALYGALGGGASAFASSAVVPGTGLLGAAVGGGLVGKYVVPEMGK